MKKTKVVLALVCAVLLVGASVMGTLAYLTSTDKVVNTFTVGKVTFGGDDHTAGLDEADVDLDGNPLKNNVKVDKVSDADRVQKNTYKLKPGHTYVKDPTIHVGEDSEECYLFVKVENGISAIEDTSNTIASQMAAKGWKSVDGVANVYVYVATAGATTPAKVQANADVVVFENFKIAGTATNDSLKSYENAKIEVTAYGVQADGFEGSEAVSIWNAAGFATMTVNPSTETKDASTDPVESEDAAE